MPDVDREARRAELVARVLRFRKVERDMASLPSDYTLFGEWLDEWTCSPPESEGTSEDDLYAAYTTYCLDVLGRLPVRRMPGFRRFLTMYDVQGWITPRGEQGWMICPLVHSQSA